MELSLNSESLKEVLASLSSANQTLMKQYPGESPERQPVHTLYGGAQLFKSDSTQKIGNLAVKNFHEYAPNFVVFAKALKLDGHQLLSDSKENIAKFENELKNNNEKYKLENESIWLAYTVYNKIAEKIKREAVEDFRIDFEDGFGNRPDDEEDSTAKFAAEQLAKGMSEKTVSPFIGIRIKPFTEELKNRSIRTLDIFLTTLLNNSSNKLPNNFVITLPKVTITEQVTALVKILELIENKMSLPNNTIKLEIMIETTQSIFNTKGESNLLAFVNAANGRCTGAHFGVYDYTASCDITAKYQSMDHPVCDFARHMMKVALASTGVWLSDGATNVMPVGPNRAKDGQTLTEQEIKENHSVVHAAWKLDYDHIEHSLRHGFYQGWDLHPAQLPIRYAACYTFFLQGLSQASIRLKNFIEKAAQATLVGDVFDDAATGQGLLNYFLRALNCGAIDESEITATGITLEEVRGRSFLKILEARRKN
ncbi:MAG: phosphoenolpyruvate kinase [Candidatus Sericytochromatia bacterium]|nr:phosphoenolpyruvate kinase [Candidatus Sericytochromatia bacterium]